MMWNELSNSSLDDLLAWAADQPWCRAMAACAQDKGWHSEGDVWTHTQMVCAELARLDDWPTLTQRERTVLTFTALLHDAAKPLTSDIDAETG
ncbi:MAG: HD domain-containing protein, partial [Pirellulales bacterium]|nr:HD domain-containing protein [Pirellulales bacterium]